MQSQAFDGRRLIDLTDRIDRDTAILYGGGRFGDVYKCKYRELSGSSSTVAVKSLRYFASSVDESDAINRELRRELGLWRRLDYDHRNIVSLLGVAKGFGPLDAIVLAWMPNGTLHSFIKGAGNAYSLVERLAMPLTSPPSWSSVHSIPVLHGDLTSSNILIDEECNPRLTDFGLSSAVGKLQPGMTYLNRCSASPGATRWAAPELFDDACEPKPSADLYSFGCIMLEVLSGNIPWEGKTDTVVIGLKILQRKFPDRPTSVEIQDEHWELIVMLDSRGHHRVQEAIRYATNYPSTGKKRALLIAIRHVHSKHDFHDIHWAHRDAEELYRNLMNSQGYHAEDIVLMMDRNHHPEELQPTRTNILRQIGRLVSNASDNCRVFFYYTGHGLTALEEVSRPDEIIAADGKTISGDILHERLVTSLTKVEGSKLFVPSSIAGTPKFYWVRDQEPTRRSGWLALDECLKATVTTPIVHLLRSRKKYSRKVDPSSSPQPNHIILSNKPESRSLDVTRAEPDTQRPNMFFLDALAARPDLSWVELNDELKARISEMRARYAAYLQSLQVDDDMAYEPWTQEPRYSTSSHTDLTRKVSL
ncbi:kinase-like domain-containing protein [Lanmaoa asiatica]|nr:kinase-like domain-containing protein [Lanmaoa asiatica]